MGFLTRALVPRGVRRAAHPVRTAKRAATPKTIKKARRALSPIDNAMYDVERKLNTKSPKQKRKATRPSRKHGGLFVGAWIADRSKPGMQGRVIELLDDGSAVTIWDDGETRTVRAG
jgi:hypothetical protein